MIGYHIAPEHRDQYDGCSLVDWFPWLGLVVPEFDECCQMHDELYIEQEGGALGREIADRLFLACMERKARGVADPARRDLLRKKAGFRYAAVRAFGWLAWYT